MTHIRSRIDIHAQTSRRNRTIPARAVQKIQSVHPKLFIAGHSHILKVIYDPVYDLLLISVNPGAYAPPGPISKIRLGSRE